MKKQFLFLGLFLFTISLVFPGKLWATSGIDAGGISSLQFNNQAEGTFSTAQTIQLKYNGTGDGVIWTITLGGVDPLQFFIVEDSCSVTVLSPMNPSCTIQVAYRPSSQFPDAVGPAQAKLLVPFNDPSDTISISLTGTGVAPEIESNFSTIDFGTGVIGELSPAQTVIITNTGGANLVLEDTKITGENSADFGLTTDLCSFQTLSPGETCQIELSIRPTGVGTRAGSLVIKNNDTDEHLFVIQLLGDGKGSGGCALIPSGGDLKDLIYCLFPFAGLTFMVWKRGRANQAVG